MRAAMTQGERGVRGWARDRRKVVDALKLREHLHLHQQKANGNGGVRWMLVLDTDVREYAHPLCEAHPERCIDIPLTLRKNGGNK